MWTVDWCAQCYSEQPTAICQIVSEIPNEFIVDPLELYCWMWYSDVRW